MVDFLIGVGGRPGAPVDSTPAGQWSTPGNAVREVPESVWETVAKYEAAGKAISTPVCVQIYVDIVHFNIMMVSVVVYGAATPDPAAPIIFTSLNLWHDGEDFYVFDMQDGKTSGLDTLSLKDHKIETPAQFIEHVLHDLFYGW
jgi:hypothetical protein